MATLPTLESIFLEVHQSLGLPPFTSKKKASFSDLGMSLENHNKVAVEILDSICDALNMDDQAKIDLVENIFTELALFNKAIELHTWTFEADKRQILWHFLGYVFVPWLARKLAFWNLPENFDAGMPRGDFWFLPTVNESEAKMPITKVVDWLLDLLGSPMDNAKDGFGGQRAKRVGNQDSIERNIYNWKNGNIPKAKKIQEYFPDDAVLDFKGIFEIETDLDEQASFEKALEFVKRKNLDAAQLRMQISMIQENRIESILEGTASNQENKEFVRLLLQRYARPDMRTIRQRFLVARMIQDGYQRLVNFLCPEIDKTCSDQTKNKILQLIFIFKVIYNFTITANQNHDSEEAEDIWFEDQLPFWDKEGLFLTISPSRRETSHLEVAKLLSRRFSELSENMPLEDLFLVDIEPEILLMERKVKRIEQDISEAMKIEKLLKQLLSGSAWRILQKENSYWVVSQIAANPNISSKAKDAAIQRTKELATTPCQKIGIILPELHYLLNCNIKQRPKDAEKQVQQLLNEAKENEQGYLLWKAPLLQYEAKHLLAQNDFNAATIYFRDALKAYSERGYGNARGETARDTFAIHVANGRLINGNHEKYYRNMLAYNMFEGDVPSLEDTAVQLADYFWDDLYKPYPKYENKKPALVKHNDVLIKEIWHIFGQGNWDEFNNWMKRNAKLFKTQQLQEVRGDTVLILWLNMLVTGREKLSKMPLPAEYQRESKKIETLFNNMEKGIILLAKTWSKQVNISDFKGQTPLMLATSNNEKLIFETLLIEGADINVQDYHGRTALHSAVTSSLVEFVKLLLAQKPDISKVTIVGSNVMHCAIRTGNFEIVRLLLAYEPELLSIKNGDGQMPLEIAMFNLDNYSLLQKEMRKHNHTIGRKQDFQTIISLLEESVIA